MFDYIKKFRQISLDH